MTKNSSYFLVENIRELPNENLLIFFSKAPTENFRTCKTPQRNC